MEIDKKYKPIIGLEIHVELNTESKMFCQCPAQYFGEDPNTHTCPVCLGMPGGLPVPNETAIESTMKIGNALGCDISEVFRFDRKHYFYPDLPKGYQISQYRHPIAENGKLSVMTPSGVKEFGITRVHLEEDTGKLTHAGVDTLIDYNRSGVPLVEIVTEPDFHDGEDVKAFLEELQVIVRYLGVANADMEKGDMRLEPNISVQLVSKMPDLPDYKVEVKNINSFRFAKKSIEYEIERHIEILESGETPIQETRGWDSNTSTTVSQRVKEDADDYRYFPEPDIPPFEYKKEQIEDILSSITELPLEKSQRFVSEFGLKEADAQILTKDKALADFFESVVKEIDLEKSGQKVANYIINNKVSSDTDVKKVVEEILKKEKPVETDTDRLDEVVEQVIAGNDKAVEDIKSGKNPNAVMFLVGQVMKEMKGQADANTVRETLEGKLK
jgi:aspartyl-tRNA(Asn)/glutamyl-tRNA(Gln) amidotransferase subunit B